MFKLKTKRWGEIEVSFGHINPVNGWDGMPPWPGTQCYFNYNQDKHEWLALGYSNLHPLDFNSYCKETGRKLSLARTLQDLGATRAERTQFWDTYFKAREKAREKSLNSIEG